jgi:hypothetical protein
VNEFSWHRLGSSGRRKGTMVRAFVLYVEEPDPERYVEHVEFCRRVEVFFADVD